MQHGSGMCIRELNDLLSARAVSPVDLVTESIRVTERWQTKTNAYITFLPEQALTDAKAAEAEIRQSGTKSLLHGIPVAVKDVYRTKGVRTTVGSKQMQDYVPDYDCAVVERLKAGGAILMGKTNMQEWGCGATGEDSYFGPARNPWNLACIAGGSSGGSAIAVATGMVPAAMGSDSGGSTRIPAALCGVVGFKPSLGRISLFGEIPMSAHLGHAGILSRTVEDAAAVMDTVAGHDPRDPVSLPDEDCGSYYEAARCGKDLSGVRIGVPDHMLHAADARVLACFYEALSKMEARGATICHVEIPMLEDSAAVCAAIMFPELGFSQKHRLETDRAGYTPFVLQRIEKAFTFTGVQYLEGLDKRRSAIAEWNRLTAKLDAVALPTTPVTAFPLYQRTLTLNGELMSSAADLLVTYTRFGNLVGCPAISLPMGLVEGLPAGLMLMGGIEADAKLLRIANAAEQSMGFVHSLVPETESRYGSRTSFFSASPEQ